MSSDAERRADRGRAVARWSAAGRDVDRLRRLDRAGRRARIPDTPGRRPGPAPAVVGDAKSLLNPPRSWSS